MDKYPHKINQDLRKKSTVYVASDKLSFNKKLLGWGTFRLNNKLVLTKQGSNARSQWELPSFFKDVKITYHSSKSWKSTYFQSAHRGQEFVIEENAEITKWAEKLINQNETFV